MEGHIDAYYSFKDMDKITNKQELYALINKKTNNNLDTVQHGGRVYLAWRTAPTHFASDQVQTLQSAQNTNQFTAGNAGNLGCSSTRCMRWVENIDIDRQV